jgi:hypothetical protein
VFSVGIKREKIHVNSLYLMLCFLNLDNNKGRIGELMIVSLSKKLPPGTKEENHNKNLVSKNMTQDLIGKTTI